MLRPAITDYMATLENPEGVFRTLGEISAERDIYGAVQFLAGNSAAIFRYTAADGQRRFLKCYIRPNRHLRTIYDYIESQRPPLLPWVRLLREEIFVHTPDGGTGWVDVVEGEWTEGETLAAAIARSVRRGDGKRLGKLADAFDTLAGELAAAEWAHGDLKPENIVVRPDGSLILIDCDAMWVPPLKGQKGVELGTPPYRDPERTPDDFDKSIDDRPVHLISAALHALALRPGLWKGYTTFEELEVV